MKSVVYHPLAESELIGSAAFYEQRRAFPGGKLVDFVEEAEGKIRQNPGWASLGNFAPEAGESGNFLFVWFTLKKPIESGLLQLPI